MFNTDNVPERQLKKIFKMQKLAKMYGLCKIITTPSDMKAKITTCLINNFFHLP